SNTLLENHMLRNSLTLALFLLSCGNGNNNDRSEPNEADAKETSDTPPTETTPAAPTAPVTATLYCASTSADTDTVCSTDDRQPLKITSVVPAEGSAACDSGKRYWIHQTENAIVTCALCKATF